MKDQSQQPFAALSCDGSQTSETGSDGEDSPLPEPQKITVNSRMRRKLRRAAETARRAMSQATEAVALPVVEDVQQKQPPASALFILQTDSKFVCNTRLRDELLQTNPPACERLLTHCVHPAWFAGWLLNEIDEAVEAAYESAMDYQYGRFTVCDPDALKQQLHQWVAGTITLEEIRLDRVMYSAFVYTLAPASLNHTHHVQHYWMTVFGKTSQQIEQHIRRTIPADICQRASKGTWTYTSLVEYLLAIALNPGHFCPFVSQEAAECLRQAYWDRGEKIKALRANASKTAKASDTGHASNTGDADDRVPRWKNPGQGKSKRKSART